MANYSLILKVNPDFVQQIVKSEGEKFEVHSTFEWIEGPEIIEDGKEAFDYCYQDGKIVLRTPPPSSYEIERRNFYPTIGDQLDALWHDMNSGKIPGKEDSEWFNMISDIKNQYPKPE